MFTCICMYIYIYIHVCSGVCTALCLYLIMCGNVSQLLVLSLPLLLLLQLLL